MEKNSCKEMFEQLCHDTGMDVDNYDAYWGFSNAWKILHQQTQEQFEIFANKKGLYLRKMHDSDKYWSDETQLAYEAYEAARALTHQPDDLTEQTLFDILRDAPIDSHAATKILNKLLPYVRGQKREYSERPQLFTMTLTRLNEIKYRHVSEGLCAGANQAIKELVAELDAQRYATPLAGEKPSTQIEGGES